MKIVDIVEGGSGSGRPDENTRSKKNLWFKSHTEWLVDLRNVYPDADFDMLSTNDDKDGDLYVVDQSHKLCYGCWRVNTKSGISFVKPRPLHVVAGPRVQLVRMVEVPIPTELS